MRRKLLPLILGGALSIAAVAPAAAADCATTNRGGVAGIAALIAANVQAGVNLCEIDILNNSLNNLLQNADIDVLNNVLNNSLNNLLQNADINVLNVDLLSGTITVIDASGSTFTFPVTLS